MEFRLTTALAVLAGEMSLVITVCIYVMTEMQFEPKQKSFCFPPA